MRSAFLTLPNPEDQLSYDKVPGKHAMHVATLAVFAHPDYEAIDEPIGARFPLG